MVYMGSSNHGGSWLEKSGVPSFRKPTRRMTAKRMETDGEEGDHFDVVLPPDAMENVLSRLPARSFAAACCVCRSWNRLCARVLSRPKLLSALSCRPTLQDAVDEACHTVLSEPIRPHFAIAYVWEKFCLKEALRLLKGKLSSSVPMIVCSAPGIIGRNAQTKAFEEVLWPLEDCRWEEFDSSSESDESRGLALTVGFVPGLKVAVMPVRRVDEECNPQSLVDLFARTYTESFSGSSRPTGIIMFADEQWDAGRGITYFLEKMDEALRNQNHIIPIAGCLLHGHRALSAVEFLYKGGEYLSLGTQCNKMECSQSSKTKKKRAGATSDESVMFDVVCLVFAEDKEKSCGAWEIQFNVAISHGLSLVGPTYKAASVRKIGDSGSFTWMNARKEGSLNLDGNSLLSDLENEVGYEKARNAFYIQVDKRRKPAVSSRKRTPVTSFALHEITGSDEEYLYVRGCGIRTGDAFRFCVADIETAYASRAAVIKKFVHLKGEGSNGPSHSRDEQAAKELQVFGGLIFACVGRGEPFFRQPSVDSSTFLEVFPDAPLVGTFCMGEIGPSIKEIGEENRSSCSLNRFSTVFLVMTYSPKYGHHKEN